ncbi:histidine triad (HIT) family protein [Paramicrobacterium humi]|uniref:Histidine triad (HIT) family protein n=1 Tax=Paramicrobacterium humi TaxID=640635 RepID=A0A1H4QHS2_9MICO|nr:HIT family protein [Microbacterium humi]SEC19140.1 histidine triad (HIT) family protein [Microbacterium humi]
MTPRRLDPDANSASDGVGREARSDCAFCRIVAEEESAEIVLANEAVVGFLDRRPVFKGHVLLVPREHVETLPELPDRLIDPLFGAARLLAAALPAAYQAQGTFVAMNNVVSQSVKHLHIHVVPRTKGDGLRGFFWPRTTYAPGEMREYADRLRSLLADESAGRDDAPVA